MYGSGKVSLANPQILVVGDSNAIPGSLTVDRLLVFLSIVFGIHEVEALSIVLSHVLFSNQFKRSRIITEFKEMGSKQVTSDIKMIIDILDMVTEAFSSS